MNSIMATGDNGSGRRDVGIYFSDSCLARLVVEDAIEVDECEECHVTRY